MNRSKNLKALVFTSTGHVLRFSQARIIVAARDCMVRTEFIDSNAVTPETESGLTAENNTGTPCPLSRVIYRNVWDGITIVYEADEGAIARGHIGIKPMNY